jgi:hypothetical protein
VAQADPRRTGGAKSRCNLPLVLPKLVLPAGVQACARTLASPLDRSVWAPNLSRSGRLRGVSPALLRSPHSPPLQKSRSNPCEFEPSWRSSHPSLKDRVIHRPARKTSSAGHTCQIRQIDTAVAPHALSIVRSIQTQDLGGSDRPQPRHVHEPLSSPVDPDPLPPIQHCVREARVKARRPNRVARFRRAVQGRAPSIDATKRRGAPDLQRVARISELIGRASPSGMWGSGLGDAARGARQAACTRPCSTWNTRSGVPNKWDSGWSDVSTSWQ